MKIVKIRNDVSSEEHYAALVFKKRVIFDRWDDRNDEHMNYVEYIQFESLEELQNWVLYNSSGLSYKIINVRDVKLEMQINVKTITKE